MLSTLTVLVRYGRRNSFVGKIIHVIALRWLRAFDEPCAYSVKVPLTRGRETTRGPAPPRDKCCAKSTMRSTASTKACDEVHAEMRTLLGEVRRLKVSIAPKLPLLNGGSAEICEVFRSCRGGSHGCALGFNSCH